MQRVRARIALVALGLGIAGGGVALAAPAAVASSGPSRIALAGSLTSAAERAHPQAKVAASSSVTFDLVLSVRNLAAAQAELKAVSDPTSASYRHYLTDAQWEARYSPTAATITSAKAWLRSQGFSVGAVPSDRLFVAATGTATQVEKAFGTTLHYYSVGGHSLRLADSTLSVPSAIAGFAVGAAGVNESLATPDLSTTAVTAATAAAKVATATTTEPTPPAGYRNPEPCSAYWGAKTDTADSSALYAPYKAPLAYDICGYTPSQLRAGYGLTKSQTGAGVSVAIVDAYDSPTLLSDARYYFQKNDPSIPLSSSQFFDFSAMPADDVAECGGSGWYDEQALDVEAVHTMAPGANIGFFGATDCLNTGLLNAITSAITSGASVVSNSYGDTAGDLLDDISYKTAEDDAFMLADTTGVSVLFSSGDSGDNFAGTGLTSPDYPASSPYVTAVGGTTLEVNQTGREAEYGWSTGTQLLCAEQAVTNCGKATTPDSALGFDAGGGGGTSYTYTEPYYQDGVVPAALTLKNYALFGPTPTRVIPDISMDADAQSGLLIGLTQVFQNGTYYAQFKEGGTSLASPLLAGVIADADQAAGVPLGFLNPALYKADSTPGAINDIVPPAKALSAAVARVNFDDGINPKDGYDVFMRTFDYQGPETYCDETGNCATRDVTLSTAKGFDSMTGLGAAGPSFISTLAKE